MPAVSTSSDSDDDAEEQVITPANVSTQVELISDDSAKVQELTERVIYLERQLEFKRFRLTNHFIGSGICERGLEYSTKLSRAGVGSC